MQMYIIDHLIRTAKLGTDVSIHYLGGVDSTGTMFKFL